jgi:hypothetical protein
VLRAAADTSRRWTCPLRVCPRGSLAVFGFCSIHAAVLQSLCMNHGRYVLSDRAGWQELRSPLVSFLPVTCLIEPSRRRSPLCPDTSAFFPVFLSSRLLLRVRRLRALYFQTNWFKTFAFRRIAVLTNCPSKYALAVS